MIRKSSCIHSSLSEVTLRVSEHKMKKSLMGSTLCFVLFLVSNASVFVCLRMCANVPYAFEQWVSVVCECVCVRACVHACVYLHVTIFVWSRMRA